jgi:hypothetical protein
VLGCIENERKDKQMSSSTTYIDVSINALQRSIEELNKTQASYKAAIISSRKTVEMYEEKYTQCLNKIEETQKALNVLYVLKDGTSSVSSLKDKLK